MLIPHLHFCGDCEKAIVLYEKVFNIKAENIVQTMIMRLINVKVITT